MTRTATGLGIAAALGFAVSLGAQTTTTTTPPTSTTQSTSATTAGQHSMRGDKDHDVTVTGCLARGSDGTFMLNNARMDNGNSSTTTTTGTTGSGAVGTTAAEPSGRQHANGAAMSWTLEGGKDLERHVGHEIQVTGRTDWNEHSSMSSSTSTTTTTGTSGSSSSMKAGGARLDVSSVKMISSSCQ
ncbi:MAG TPA: hypothetical protein VFA27_11885 [Vicinamibacterales bacterium]|nr:hypothetical protein [Vicinamibacterales bacterium]